MVSWASLQEQEIRSERGQITLEYNKRVYVRNRAPYLANRWWAEYFVCAHGCSTCHARVVRYTPLDGSPSYVKRSTSASAHDQLCVRSAQKILIRKAVQEVRQAVVGSSAVNGTRRSTRDVYDSMGRLLHLHAGRPDFFFFLFFQQPICETRITLLFV